MVTPITTALSIVRTTSGATGSLTNEAMSELDWTSLGYPAKTVYQITSTTKRYLARSAIPTFEVDDGGGFDPLTPAEIQYAGGVIILSAPLAGAYTVRCATGTYYTTITDLLGGSVARVTTGPQLVETPLLGDAFVRRWPVVTDFTVTLDTFVVSTCASYTTALAGSNDDLVFTHTAGGTVGNSYTIVYTDPGAASQSLAVTVSGYAVTVSLATDGAKAITSTALQIMNAINTSPGCKFINLGASLATGSTGAGVVTAMSVQSLAGGLNVASHTAKFGVTLIMEVYMSTSADTRLEGYCYLESVDGSYDPKSVITENLSFKGDGRLYYRPA
jgi:hypothetical protein